MTDRWVLVSGASYGVGRAVAIHLSTCGYSTVLTGRNETALKKTASRVDETSSSILIPADLRKPGDIEAIVATLGRTGQALHGFVHCAFGHIGEEEGRSLESVSTEEIQDFVATSVTGTYLLTRALVPLLREAGGRIIFMIADWGLPAHNVLLAAGKDDDPIGSEIFNSAKHAMTGFVNSLERLSGIRASGIYPGIIASANNKEYPPSEAHDGYLDLNSSRDEVAAAGYDTPNDSIPLNDIARAVEFCMTTEATVRAIHLKPVDFFYTGA